MQPFYIQSGTGAQLSAQQVASGNFNAGTSFVHSGTGAQMTQAQIQASLAPTTTPAPAPTPTTVNTSGNPNANMFQNVTGPSITPTPAPTPTPAAPASSAPLSTSTTASAPTTALQPGSTDTANVKALQDYLVSKGFMTQDQVNTGYGIYGPQTTAAVANLQKSLGVDNSSGPGDFGPQTMSALAGQGQPPQYSAPSSLGSSSMQNSGGSSNFTTPGTDTSSTSDLAALTAKNAQQLADAEKLGPQDQQESDLIAQIQALNTQDAGKSDFQNQQNTANGVDSAQATINSLQATQKQNLDAYNASQLQDQQGQGVTTAIDDRQRAAVTKQYAINSLATSSLLAAAQGDLANAQLLANKAVAAKFDPIEAQITASKANLALIAADPKTTAEEKARVDAIQKVLDAQTAATTQAKANATAVQNIAVDAASYTPNFTATSQYKTAAQALQAIQNSSDPVAAQTIATQTGLTAPTNKYTHISATANQPGGTFDSSKGQFTPSGGGSGGGGAASYSFVPTVKTALYGDGETAASIAQLESDIAQYGPQAVLDNGQELSAATQATIEKTFNVTKTAAAAATNTSNAAATGFSLFNPSTWF